MGESSKTTDVRRPSSTSPSRMEQALERAAGAESRRGATPTGVTTDGHVEEPLDWIAFRDRFFPGSARHDLAALHAYGVYRAQSEWSASHRKSAVKLAVATQTEVSAAP